MNILGYTIEGNGRALKPITSFKIHRYHPRSRQRHLVWWRFSLMWGPTEHCEACGVETGLLDMCEDCYSHHFCECGQRLCDAAGSPGDGFCVRCR